MDSKLNENAIALATFRAVWEKIEPDDYKAAYRRWVPFLLERVAESEGEAERLRAVIDRLLATITALETERDEWKPALQEKVRDFHEMMDWMGTTCKGHEDMGTFQFIASLVYDRYYLRSIYNASARISDIRLARMAELETERDGWYRATMAGAAHICCEECQSECDHDPGFGFDAEMYDSAPPASVVDSIWGTTRSLADAVATLTPDHERYVGD